jgi:hypothetical protein
LHWSGLTVSTIDISSSGFIHLSPDVLPIIPNISGIVSCVVANLIRVLTFASDLLLVGGLS